MKSKLPFLFLILTHALIAQNFTEALHLLAFDGVVYSSVDFADVNNDGSKDVLITGQTDPFGDELISKLYTNDGMGNFTEKVDLPFEGVLYGSIAFTDVNGDGSEDVLITGAKDELAVEAISKLYTNDGMGNFTEMIGTPFEGVWLSSIAFADVNGDVSKDVLITGQNNSGQQISKLYINDGNGNFTEMLGAPFVGVEYSSIAFADVNNDGSEDVLITGRNNSVERISKLYTNDGMGNFTEMPSTPFDGVENGSIAFADVNGDGSEDVLITGLNSSDERISKLYTNDGIGNFTEMTETPFDGVWLSSIAFADIDGNGSEDVLITGHNSSFFPISKMYTNDGMGNFIEVPGTPFEGVQYSSIAFEDINSDGSEDILITGLNISNEIITALYTNDNMISSPDDLLADVNFKLTPFPNPVKSNNLNVIFNSTKNNFISLEVYDLNGHLIIHQKVFVNTGKQTLEVDVTSLPKGNYFCKLRNHKILGVAKFIIL